MNTTVESPTKTEYLYVKDLPDVGGLRARRMGALRTEVLAAQRMCQTGGAGNRAIVVQEGPEFKVMAPWGGVARALYTESADVIEVYDLNRDLAPQFAEQRAIHW